MCIRDRSYCTFYCIFHISSFSGKCWVLLQLHSAVLRFIFFKTLLNCTIYSRRINIGWSIYWFVSRILKKNHLPLKDNKHLNYCRDSARWRMVLIFNIQGHSRSYVVVPIDAVYMTFYRHSIVTLTSILNRSWDITPSLHIYTTLLFQVELEKDGWE